ncbi:MAG: cytochrome c maturation protein CcmE [Ignavibacteriaceae bacterium]|nr:cytochrome c maturation protein CcmE [Ignavibacteriaceae bacterium]
MKKNKYIFGIGIISVFLGIMVYLFTQSNIGYENDFKKIMSYNKPIRATGSWVKERDYSYKNNEFVFYMQDEAGTQMKVIYNGVMPNNFEHATSVVVTGRYENGYFHAKDILTKCPSKYQESDAVAKS